MVHLILGYNTHIALRQRRVRTTCLCAQTNFELLSKIVDQYLQNDESERFISLRRGNHILLIIQKAHRENSNNFFVFEISSFFSLQSLPHYSCQNNFLV